MMIKWVLAHQNKTIKNRTVFIILKKTYFKRNLFFYCFKYRKFYQNPITSLFGVWFYLNGALAGTCFVYPKY